MDSSPFPDIIDKERDDPNLISESGNKRKDAPTDGGVTSQLAQPKRKPSTRSTVWGHFTRFDDNLKRSHFIDVSWRLRKLIIGFKYITDHKGATISRVLLDCLAEWGIEEILTVTVDNETTNTSPLKKFQEAFSLRNNEAFVLNGECMHMRCCAHIINLIVRDALHGLSENVTAIRNAVQYVRSSTSRCDSFEQKVVSGKMTRGSLPLDIKTRWNSTYFMLSRAIDFRLTFDRMEAEDKMYNDYFNEVENGKKKIGLPTRTDCSAIERLVRFLIIFYNSTSVVSASTSVASYKCYGEIVTIERNLMSLSNSIDSDLKSKADAMLLKFDKYWDGMRNINIFLIVASVFDPRKKMQFAKMCFDKLYGKDTSYLKEMSERITTFLTSLFKEYSNRL
ncbi:PREDICTED: zinc finger BED domain-containing protein RICESLEEPER 2-like [Camelina sativa]|uniref:Zinc finger BED domain-containing protein RICESLEEPER 2-like n=1 Tax=Camelina sativa TaxID=90675 RepID=A0ABM0VIV2_CAMSA|nr:PREDICTED: zinc finger BED domain-containing protein RICESLEEPER 2-like [Camelina sativa]